MTFKVVRKCIQVIRNSGLAGTVIDTLSAIVNRFWPHYLLLIPDWVKIMLILVPKVRPLTLQKIKINSPISLKFMVHVGLLFLEKKYDEVGSPARLEHPPPPPRAPDEAPPTTTRQSVVDDPNVQLRQPATKRHNMRPETAMVQSLRVENSRPDIRSTLPEPFPPVPPPLSTFLAGFFTWMMVRGFGRRGRLPSSSAAAAAAAAAESSEGVM